MIIKLESILKLSCSEVPDDMDIRTDITTRLLKEVETPGISALGLAAPQIGIRKKAFIMLNPKTNEFDAYINPKIHSHSDEKVNFVEGCLSFPGLNLLCRRSFAIEISDAVHGNQFLEGLPAIIAQHETDHLNGVLFHSRQERNKEKDRPRLYSIEDFDTTDKSSSEPDSDA